MVFNIESIQRKYCFTSLKNIYFYAKTIYEVYDGEEIQPWTCQWAWLDYSLGGFGPRNSVKFQHLYQAHLLFSYPHLPVIYTHSHFFLIDFSITSFKSLGKNMYFGVRHAWGQILAPLCSPCMLLGKLYNYSNFWFPLLKMVLIPTTWWYFFSHGGIWRIKYI